MMPAPAPTPAPFSARLICRVLRGAKLLALLGGLLALAPQAAWAQGAVRLLADQMEIVDGDTLVATGQVDILSGAMRLNASRVIYDRSKNHITVEGPLLLDDGTSTVILGSSAEVSEDLRQGLIRTAKVIIDQQLQMTASVMQRVEGRFHVLRRAKASSCQTCRGGPPLWEIRATRVVHDTKGQQLYFNNAQFRMVGVPLAYFPRLRLPDATMRRTTGFLVPELEVSSTWRLGLKMPFFLAIDPHKDLKITPYVAETGAASLDLRYRQAFATGEITANALWSRDSPESQLRTYYRVAGTFSLPRKYTLSFSGETISGSGYFASYGLNEKDRFVTNVTVARANRKQVINARVLGFYSVRQGEDNATQPSQIADFERLDRVNLGDYGDLRLGLRANIRLRASNSDRDGPDSDQIADGRDVRGFGLRATWAKGVVLPLGIMANAELGLRTDDYTVDQDAVYAGLYQRRHAALGLELRLPWVRAAQQPAPDGAARRGGMHVIEPMAQLVVASPQSGRLFNDDSALVEFDEGNLFALNRFPGSDRVETGTRTNLGAQYSYAGPEGQKARLAFGRVISNQSAAQFSAASGLGQQNSDWLVAGQLKMNNGFSTTARGLFTENRDLRKLELRGGAKIWRGGVSVGYFYAPADADEDRGEAVKEVTLSADQTFSERWNGRISARYDAQSAKLSQSGVALVYRNECLQINLSLSRSFATSFTITPIQTIGFSMVFVGFGGQPAGPSQQCRG